ncbi:predicted protein [Chaetoceros tenuissimus]|uniref:F-box domain-containing protein n=1 Tax=Chaetoceros tenuissimus TaxID=426638 RepID=A0AAD3H9N7_9STRA|nr:predicted protein [Chaetoceros tenuissimus]
MKRQQPIHRTLNGKRPSLQLREFDNFEDLPDAIIYHVMSYCTYRPSKQYAWQYAILCEGCPEGDFTLKDVSSIFKTFSLVSKRLHDCCKSFCQSTPIWIDEEWPSKYKVIKFLCKMKMKISSLGVTDLVDNPLRASLFLYLLRECDLSELKSLSMSNPAQLQRNGPYSSYNFKCLYEQHNYNLWYALDAGIPRSVFDQERTLRNTYQGSNGEEQFHILLEELLLEGICQSIRNVNMIDEIWLQVNKSNEHILKAIEACPNLQHATLKFGLGFAANLDTNQDFLERLTRNISKLAYLTFLHIESDGFDRKLLSLTSSSLDELRISMPKINMKHINCPNLTNLNMKNQGFDEAFLSNSSTPKLENLILVLEEWSKRHGSKTECMVLSKFITTRPNLKNLDFCSENKIESHLPKVKLHLESNSIEKIDATYHSTILTFTGIKCPNLKKLSVRRNYEGMTWHCHVEEELDLFDAGYEEGKTVKGDFKNLMTLKIPDNCLIYID